MGFEEFFDKYAVADWILNIFKTISPTLIALLTIWINARREKKKDKERKSIEIKKERMAIKRVVVESIQKDVLELNSMVWATGKELLNAIQYVRDEDVSEAHLEKFRVNNENMLMEARQINGKADIYLAVTGMPKIVFLHLFKELRQVSDKFLSVLDEYNRKAGVTHISNINSLFDEVQEKLISITAEYEDKLVMYCVTLNEELLKEE